MNNIYIVFTKSLDTSGGVYLDFTRSSSGLVGESKVHHRFMSFEYELIELTSMSTDNVNVSPQGLIWDRVNYRLYSCVYDGFFTILQVMKCW